MIDFTTKGKPALPVPLFSDYVGCALEARGQDPAE